MFPPNQNSGAAPVYSIYTIYLCCHLCPPKFLYVADPVTVSSVDQNSEHQVYIVCESEVYEMLNVATLFA